MSRFVQTRKLLPIVSRFITRGASSRTGIGGAVSRVIAAIAALTILVAAHSTAGLERDPASAYRPFSGPASFTALHSAPTHRVAVDSRSSTRWPSNSDVPLPGHSLVGRSETIDQPVVVVAVLGHADDSATARGYDATAPPALS